MSPARARRFSAAGKNASRAQNQNAGATLPRPDRQAAQGQPRTQRVCVGAWLAWSPRVFAHLFVSETRLKVGGGFSSLPGARGTARKNHHQILDAFMKIWHGQFLAAVAAALFLP